ncbi:hypothetical protein CVT25_000792 [Psilocybe cyanescens]|uniref:Uncharacterized protein n=1 Tax=Psilocybe cyanescens TaxID=93625 RepID=A0A409XYB0_PSICY|nr:hypothetical protein CVT25_000792 [Psilocybe cyanescens]
MPPKASKNTATVPNSPPKTRRSTRKQARAASAIDASAAGHLILRKVLQQQAKKGGVTVTDQLEADGNDDDN